MSSRIMNYMETSKPLTADDAFIDFKIFFIKYFKIFFIDFKIFFIKLQLDNIPEHEKNIRRKMIMDAISAPLS